MLRFGQRLVATAIAFSPSAIARRFHESEMSLTRRRTSLATSVRRWMIGFAITRRNRLDSSSKMIRRLAELEKQANADREQTSSSAMPPVFVRNFSSRQSDFTERKPWPRDIQVQTGWVVSSAVVTPAVIQR